MLCMIYRLWPGHVEVPQGGTVEPGRGLRTSWLQRSVVVIVSSGRDSSIQEMNRYRSTRAYRTGGNSERKVPDSRETSLQLYTRQTNHNHELPTPMAWVSRHIQSPRRSVASLFSKIPQTYQNSSSVLLPIPGLWLHNLISTPSPYKPVSPPRRLIGARASHSVLCLTHPGYHPQATVSSSPLSQRFCRMFLTRWRPEQQSWMGSVPFRTSAKLIEIHRAVFGSQPQYCPTNQEPPASKVGT